MSWKETSSGKYMRPLDNAELLLKTVATPFQALNRDHWAINFVASVKIDTKGTKDTVAALRSAWIALRYHHPQIAALLEGTTITYEVPDEEILQTWLEGSFFVHKDKNAEEYLFSAPWTEYSSLHYFPDSSELVMRTHHWLVDGVGALHIAHRFLELLASGIETFEWGNEWKRLAPSMQVATLETSDSTLGPEAGQEEATKMFMDFVGKLPSVGLPSGGSLKTPGGTLCSTLEHEPIIFDKLLAACREKGLSVTAAVHSAIVVATQEFPQESASVQNYTSFACYDYRSYMPSPYNDTSAWPLGVYMLGLPMSLSSGDFSLHAPKLQKVYKQPLTRDNLPSLKYYDQYSGMMAAALSQPPQPGMPLPTTPSLSGIGAMDRKLQANYVGEISVEIERAAFRADVMAPPIAMYQWSWRGTFVISACYNEVYYTKAFVEKFLARVEDILFQGLGCEKFSRD